MEYTKDLILKVHYQKTNNNLGEKLRKRTSYFLEKMKKHKIITSSVVLILMLVIADVLLIMNFMHALENLL
ncbi:MAG: hypothetical protein ACLR6T_09310 [Intestinibacter sp.]